MNPKPAWIAVVAILAAPSAPASAQLASPKASRYNCSERLYALSPTQEDREVSADTVAALARGEAAPEAGSLSFEDIQALKRGDAVLMHVYLVDFLRTPQDSIELETGGRLRRFTLRDYTAGMTVLVPSTGKPVQVRVRGSFHCKGKAWPIP